MSVDRSLEFVIKISASETKSSLKETVHKAGF